MNTTKARALNRAAVLGHRKTADGVCRMNSLKKLEQEVSIWPHVSVHPHPFGGREFLFNSAEVGHVHIGGIVDIPFPRSVRAVLLLEGLAKEHRWVPNSGWITFRMRSASD